VAGSRPAGRRRRANDIATEAITSSPDADAEDIVHKPLGSAAAAPQVMSISANDMRQASSSKQGSDQMSHTVWQEHAQVLAKCVPVTI